MPYIDVIGSLFEAKSNDNTQVEEAGIEASESIIKQFGKKVSDIPPFNTKVI